VLRVVVALGPRAGLHEAGDGELGDARLGAACDDDVQLTVAHQHERPGQRLRAGGACGHRRVHTTARAELEAHPRGGPVGHQHRHGQRGDLAQPLGLEQIVLREQGGDAADAGPDHHTEPLRLHLG
jgi:hypothetical protein